MLDDLIKSIDWLNEELDELGLWMFAVAYVSMTEEQKKCCRELAEQ